MSTFNLLPQKEQRALAQEYRLRLAVVTLALLVCLGVIALLSLIPSLFLIYQKSAAIAREDTLLSAELAGHTSNDPSSDLKVARAKVAALRATPATPYAYELIGAAVAGKTAGIRITGISVKRDGNGRLMAVMGEARDRDALRAFSESLQREKAFARVVVPVSNFAADTDINFSILINTGT